MRSIAAGPLSPSPKWGSQHQLRIKALGPSHTTRQKPKGGRRKGTGKKMSRHLRHFTSICDILWQLIKCRAYGQRNGYNLQALDRGMTPVVLEQFGRTAPGAQAIFNRIINHRLQLLVRQGMPFSFAKRTASSELWGPLSCTLLRAAWQAHAECTPRVGMADIYDALENLPNSPGETQLNAWAHESLG